MWDWDYTLREVLPKLLGVLHVTIGATVAGFLLALVLGLIFALVRRSKNRILAGLAGGAVEFIRLTPLLVQLYFIYFVMPEIGLTLSAFAAGALGLGIHYAAYVSEVYRAGIESVSKGQWEAATALNFSKRQMWQSIILPQAIRPIVPVLGNYLIVMFKETPYLSAIGLMEMVGAAKEIGAETFRYMEPMTLVGIFFLILSYAASLLVKRAERKMDLNRLGERTKSAPEG
ncbi:MAG: ectoine/hydroxyectoine ABC transporter permease subunit EhuD [Thermoactinomycetaceae bacterium]|uniref:ectoine/hydroxyectoine ABC transporter permease subunit EhuD n=1 Tax=Planifilum fulgidum TaxID=201973 RepID=UPI000B8A50CE|nr:ectoine/hydroxyectoine ABC transporter permease subunit EhuD [Planifilum fulgidum]MBO2496444.1 ectoine/hydroxyectoine ABC transporter permease subunit EhuD [Bacillota bacterium]MBO2531559.1 ectoine/hydroxyectoine ABC transporter permease subunit EhuD [Thermoactinomycetaceae bacterium]